MRITRVLNSRLVSTLIMVLCFGGAASAAVIYVDADAVGADDGTSWTDAHADLQDALAVAVYGDEIRVAQGVYTPDSGSGSRTAGFTLIDGVALYGGYAGWGEAVPDDRDPATYQTFLSGDLNGDDSTVGKTENSYHVVAAGGVTSAARLDGFFIVSGYADGAMPDERGAGMYVSGADPTIADCIFRDNHALGGSLGGGGLYLATSSPRMMSCRFTGNSAPIGGGMLCFIDCAPILTNCEFVKNSATGALGGGGGGGMYNWESAPSLTDCFFGDNTALDPGGSGGGMMNNEADPVCNNCTFVRNLADNRGGAIYLYQSGGWFVQCSVDHNAADYGGGIADDYSTPVFDNGVITANAAADSGGGVYAYSSSGQYLNTTFDRNQATYFGGAIQDDTSSLFIAYTLIMDNHAGSSGGGIDTSDGHPVIVGVRFLKDDSGTAGGGMMINRPGDATLINCIFSGNESDFGGGLANNAGAQDDPAPELINCSFSRNNATMNGGGILCFMGSSIEITDCILWGNTDADSSTVSLEQIYYVSATVTMTYSCVEGWTGGGAGNISSNPQFLNATGTDGVAGTVDDDLRLRLFSPCIDAGDNSVVTWSEDIDHRTRRVDIPFRVDTGSGAAPLVDMGALERQWRGWHAGH